MKIAIFSFTENGKLAANKLAKLFTIENKDNIQVSTYTSKDKVKEAFGNNDALIFICASGIAVRLIAPFIKDKLLDPAVLVCDEKMNYYIPILSGHVGGANELARKLETMAGGKAVITTATDVNDVIAIDELGARNNCEIKNRDKIKKVSSGLLRGDTINLAIADDIVITSDENDIDDEVLGLLYRPIVIGMGCKKDKDSKAIEDFFLEIVSKLEIDIKHIAGLASIDLKANEPGLVALSSKYGIPFVTFSADELNAVEGEFEGSEFVKSQVGTDDVSARAAKALGKRGKFLIKKEKRDGITISVFEKYRRISFNYEKA